MLSPTMEMFEQHVGMAKFMICKILPQLISSDRLFLKLGRPNFLTNDSLDMIHDDFRTAIGPADIAI